MAITVVTQVVLGMFASVLMGSYLSGLTGGLRFHLLGSALDCWLVLELLVDSS